MFKTIKVLLSPRKAVRTIQALTDEDGRRVGEYERALASRLAGTYTKAYDAGFKQGRELGSEEGRALERSKLLQAGVKLPKGV